MALYFGVNTGLKAALEAKDIDRVEMLSIPLQQMARTLQQNPDALPDDEARELIDAIYPYGFEEYYLPSLADPVKWASDYDVVDERMGDILSLWARMLPANLKPYMEAFLIQNLPYLLPGSEMIYYLDTESRVSEMEETFPLVEQSRIPALKELYRQYDKTLTLLGLPGVRLLSDAAFQIWLAMAGLALAVYRRQKGYMAAFTFILPDRAGGHYALPADRLLRCAGAAGRDAGCPGMLHFPLPQKVGLKMTNVSVTLFG